MEVNIGHVNHLNWNVNRKYTEVDLVKSFEFRPTESQVIVLFEDDSKLVYEKVYSVRIDNG